MLTTSFRWSKCAGIPIGTITFNMYNFFYNNCNKKKILSTWPLVCVCGGGGVGGMGDPSTCTSARDNLQQVLQQEY